MDTSFYVNFAKTAMKLSSQKAVEQGEDGTQYYTCRLGDLMVMVSKKDTVKFTGIMFTAYGLDWVVDEDYQLSLLDFSGDKMDPDEELKLLAESYLEGRGRVLEKMGF